MNELEDVVPGEELDFAVRLTLALVERGEADLYAADAEALVSASIDVVSGSLRARGLRPPRTSDIVAAVRAEQHHRALQWVHEQVLAGGDKLEGDALTDAQWLRITTTMRAVAVEPPTREAVDTSIRERWR